MTSNNYLWCCMKNYIRTLLFIIGISTGFVDSSKAMDPKEDLWQDMIQIAESRARYNQVVHNIYTDWKKNEKSLTPDLKGYINNFTQELMGIDYEDLLDKAGQFNKKEREKFLRDVPIKALQDLPLASLKNKLGWDFLERSLRAFNTPQERMAIWPRLVEELELQYAENLGALAAAQVSGGLDNDELIYTTALLQKLRTYNEQQPLPQNEKIGMEISFPNEATMSVRLPQASTEEMLSLYAENNAKFNLSAPPERLQKLGELRGFATVSCNFVNKNMNPIRDQLYVDHVLEFLSHYVIQPDINHLKTNFPRLENMKGPAVDLSEFLPPELMKAKKKKPVAPKKAAKKKPPPAKAPQKEKAVKIPLPSAQALPSPLPPVKESIKAIPVVEKLEAIPPKALPQPAAVPQKEDHPFKQELRMAFTNAYELEGYLAIFESQSHRAHVNFEDLAKGKDSSKDKKSNGLSWKNFEKFLQNKGWTVDEGLSKGSSVSFIPPRRFSALTGLTPKRINVHKPKDTKILLYEGYLKFFRSGFESMGLTEKSISDWLKVF